MLKQYEAWRRVPELAREMGVSNATIYTWNSKYGGTEVGESNDVLNSRSPFDPPSAPSFRVNQFGGSMSAASPPIERFSTGILRTTGNAWGKPSRDSFRVTPFTNTVTPSLASVYRRTPPSGS